ncbi:2Fe-2S iron-sulfur cluster-binding protein [Sphingobium sp. Sx8-8]|uniref:2Fe-2S iron-sulfur cluster-binding protein n=1 Tax=Sphingobium sp. Sx8-8 TaxID=2933617 RepID=UPI001F5A8EA7|nr:2Fe-2S iron-sulfur cluster-binding protein [Sphingobium sp. Sx8-8]
MAERVSGTSTLAEVERPASTRLTIVSRDGTAHDVEAANGESVMLAIRNHGIDELLALCGGSCSCSTCHVILDSDGMARVGQPEGDEADLLDGSLHRSPNSRLSCQIQVTPELAGLRFTIAPED